MLSSVSHFIGRIFRLFPNVMHIRTKQVEAKFFVPYFSHYVAQDLTQMAAGKREPELYSWIDNLPKHAVFFDIGTNYGQESVWASSLKDKNVTVVGFDCGLLGAHFCALNSVLNDNRFSFVFAAVGSKSGDLIDISTNSDTHIRGLHKKNVPYAYQVPSIALDDFVTHSKLVPTHLKIDVDGAEVGVLQGAQKLLENDVLREIFIEVERDNLHLIDMLQEHGFAIKWHRDKPQNSEYILTRN
ncbi:FkbM family methyltransferase [Candidatus Puniceispirillum sp.]|uniref:FkbM family methyltransferase n=1 Tax=Candidatus Puniceispirillum sp. TaxID=2026719 RepID=UPI001ED4746C|nr:FkbM family methyltransferase [Candidatus Puniceispirillum sp.]